MNLACPVFCVCGYSGSGKTTLLEALLQKLTARDLRVGAVKQDAHGLVIDKPGRDTDRLFRAGADVFIRGPHQAFLRVHRHRDMPLGDVLRAMAPFYDLILIEGHKSTPLEPKIWLSGDAHDQPPPEACPVLRVLRRDEDRVGALLDMIDAWLPAAWLSVPVYAGILIGGASRRFGRPKHLEPSHGETWAERLVRILRPHVAETILIGSGGVPPALANMTVLPDVPGVAGPLAGMRAAARWLPSAAWIFVPCDIPFLEGDAVAWLLDQRKPGVWAVLPQLPQAPGPEPLLAYYDCRSASLLESIQRPSEMARQSCTSTPLVPLPLRASWANINTVEELAAATAAGSAPVGTNRVGR